jgi:uncharacterized protein YceK
LRIVVWSVRSLSGAETSGTAHSHADQDLTFSLFLSTVYLPKYCSCSS